MNNVTRTFNLFRATFFEVSIANGKPELEEVGSVEYQATTPNRSTAIKELKAAGFDVPKGAVINVEDLGKRTYACTMAAFMSVATLVEE